MPLTLGSKSVDSDDDGTVPDVSDEDIAAAVQHLPEVPITNVDDSDRFVIEIRRLVEERAQDGWPNEGDANVAAFVMVPYPRQVKERYDNERVLDLRAGSRSLLGDLFFLSIDGTHGCAMPMPVGDADILDWLEDKGFQECPVVLIYRGTLTMVSRASGASGEATTNSIRETVPAATLDELLESLVHFHSYNLLTPTLCPKGVWEPKRTMNYVPGPQPEIAIQDRLIVALNSWFHGELRAEKEDSIKVGRIDVRLLQTNPNDGALSYWAIIELKVMRSNHNAPEGKKAKSVSLAANVGAVVEGLKQIDSYKRDRLAPEGLLEVFDMRKDKTKNVKGQKRVKDQLVKCDDGIAFNVRPLFGEAKHARDAGY